MDNNLNLDTATCAVNFLQCGDTKYNDLNLNELLAGSTTTTANSMTTAGGPGMTYIGGHWTDADHPISGWDYWHQYYYPYVIRESYPVYIQERAQDKGKQAYEIIKTLNDKHLLKLDTVRDFIEAMDTLLKIL